MSAASEAASPPLLRARQAEDPDFEGDDGKYDYDSEDDERGRLEKAIARAKYGDEG